jgi:hypothetical protein
MLCRNKRDKKEKIFYKSQLSYKENNFQSTIFLIPDLENYLILI